jgi:hypothetical protein
VSLLLIISTPLVEWHLMVRGGYAGVVLGAAVILSYAADLLAQRARAPGRFFVFGLICGVAYYNFELIVPLLVVLLAASALHRELFWRKPALLGGAAGFIVGASPVILFNALHHFANFRYVYGRARGGGGLDLLSRIAAVFGERLPRFFVGANVNRFVRVAPGQAYLEYAAYLLLMSSCGVGIALELRRRARELGPEVGVLFALRDAAVGVQLEAVLVLYLGVYLAQQCVTKVEASPRFFLPMFPALAILATRGAVRLGRQGGRTGMLVGSGLLASLVICGALTHAVYLGAAAADHEQHGSAAQVRRHQAARNTTREITGYLRAHSVTRVWADYWILWPLMLESGLGIVGSCAPIDPSSDAQRLVLQIRNSRYPAFDELTANAPGPTAIIIKSSDTRLPAMWNQPFMRGFPTRTRIGDVWVLLR